MQSLPDSIHKLAQSANSRSEFCQGILEEVAIAMKADAGVIWDTSNGSILPVGQYSKGKQPARIPLTQEAHSKLLGEAADQQRPMFIRSQANEETGAAPMFLMVGHFSYDGNYLVELFIEGMESPNEQTAKEFAGILKSVSDTVETLPDVAAKIQKQTQTADTPAPVSLSSERVSDYLNTIHTSIDRGLTCSNVANETRRFLDCDRVSVVLKHRGRFRIFSISGQPSVNRKSNTTKLLEKLAKRLLKTGQSFWYPDETEIPTQISEVLDPYLSVSATRSMVIEPIYEKVVDTVTDPESLESKNNPVIGGIIFEHCHDLWERRQIEDSLNFTSLHGGNAIRNAKKHHSLFLYPLLNLLSKSRFLMASRVLPKTLMACAGTILVGLILAFWPVDFYVSANGLLVPESIKPVFSSADGDVSQLMVQHGSQVKQGDTLLVLTSREQEIRAKDLESRIRSAQQRLETIQDQIFEARDDGSSLQDSIQGLRSQIVNYQEQQTILEKMASGMTVTSPLDGQVISWDLEQRLDGRAIQRGQELLEVAALNGKWQLEIELPVNRYCHLVREMKTNKEPKISFLLAADTSKRYHGKIVEVETSASLNADNEQFIRLKADLESSDLHIEQARTGVTAKIYCGRASLGYLWFHDIGEFIQKNVLFQIR